MSTEVLTIGTDPEFFLFNDIGRPVSAHTCIPGTKDKPYQLSGLTTCQLDGVACELGIKPAANAYQFVNRIREALNCASARIPRGHSLKAVPSVFFDKEYYDNSIPAECKVLGCTPDRDAYNDGKINPIPNIVSNINGVMRTGGGHIHFGWTKNEDVNDQDHINNCILVIRNIDYLFTFFELLWDNDTQRRLMYGKPGAFRVKPYGCEYRSPSNAWLENSQTQTFVFELSRYAFWATYAGIDLRTHVETTYDIKDLRDLYDVDPNTLHGSRYTETRMLGKLTSYHLRYNTVFPDVKDHVNSSFINTPPPTTYARYFNIGKTRTPQWDKMRVIYKALYNGYDYFA